MAININKDAELIRLAAEGAKQRIAFNYGRSREWLARQYSGEYPNFWTTSKRWVRAFATVDIYRGELFFNDFDLFRRELLAEVRGLILPFPIEQQKQLIDLRSRLDAILG